MSTHERQDIRTAVVAMLKGPHATDPTPVYATSAGKRVFKTRMAPVRQAELPAIAVYTDSEEVDPDVVDVAPRELRRTLQVAIEGWARASANVDDALDALALEIETAMDADLNLKGTAYTSVLTSTELGVKMDGDDPMGAVRLVYTVVYHSDMRVAPPSDTFDTVDIKYDLSNAQDPDDQAEDLVTGINEE